VDKTENLPPIIKQMIDAIRNQRLDRNTRDNVSMTLGTIADAIQEELLRYRSTKDPVRRNTTRVKPRKTA
jgi:hypothetical protein